MSVKRILVPLSGDSADVVPLETAVAVAKLFDAHLEALYLKPDLQRRLGQLAQGEGGVLDDSFFRSAMAESERAADEARGWFEAFARNHDMPIGDDPMTRPGASWHAGIEGAETLARHGGFVDLVVIGRPASDHEPASTILDTALFTTGHALLIAPPAVPTRVAERVIVGWNGTVQSERAIMRAVPFLQCAEQVVIVAILTGAKRGPAAADAARYLAWHDVSAAVKEVEPSHRAVGEILLDEAGAMNADLLVMGAYSHSRLREMILGGVTRYILNHAELPVLMAH